MHVLCIVVGFQQLFNIFRSVSHLDFNIVLFLCVRVSPGSVLWVYNARFRHFIVQKGVVFILNYVLVVKHAVEVHFVPVASLVDQFREAFPRRCFRSLRAIGWWRLRNWLKVPCSCDDASSCAWGYHWFCKFVFAHNCWRHIVLHHEGQLFRVNFKSGVSLVVFLWILGEQHVFRHVNDSWWAGSFKDHILLEHTGLLGCRELLEFISQVAGTAWSLRCHLLVGWHEKLLSVGVQLQSFAQLLWRDGLRRWNNSVHIIIS